MLFDAADAMFGKRSEESDSHDRYANNELRYRLHCIKPFQVRTILSANMKHVLDQAFLCRLRIVIKFPGPTDSRRCVNTNRMEDNDA